MEESFINILGADEIDTLFGTGETTEKETQEEGDQEMNETSENQKENNETTTTEVEGATLFEEESKPESVGSEDKQEGEEEGSSTDNGGGTSPKDNFYSSIANAMAEDGIFPNLDEEMISKADSAEALSDLIEAEVNARLDEKQQRIAKALENGVEPSEVRSYEQALQFLGNIKETDLADETEKGESLRQRIIYQDFINKGYPQQRAEKLTRRSIEAGTDIEDAKDALQSNKDFFQDKYDELLKDAQESAEKEKENRF